MVLKIRMRQQGRKNRQTFRFVVTDIRNPRDGKYVETLGSYDPNQKQNNMRVNKERLGYWLSKGAQLSENAEKLIKGIAPDVICDLKQKQNAARIKQAAKRRKKKIAAPKGEVETITEAPKNKRSTVVKTVQAKKDES